MIPCAELRGRSLERTTLVAQRNHLYVRADFGEQVITATPLKSS
jgi:hypothetical protein